MKSIFLRLVGFAALAGLGMLCSCTPATFSGSVAEDEADGPPVPPTPMASHAGTHGTEAVNPSSIVVEAMSRSIQKGEIKRFSYDQVRFWRVVKDEIVDGNSYQVGITVFDVRDGSESMSYHAKAYVSNGRVWRWVWPDTGLAIQ